MAASLLKGLLVYQVNVLTGNNQADQADLEICLSLPTG